MDVILIIRRSIYKNKDYFIAQSFGYYGYIKPEHADCVIIIGPVFSTPISDLTLRTFMQEWAISQEHKPDILQFLVKLVGIMKMLFFLCINHLIGMYIGKLADAACVF